MRKIKIFATLAFVIFAIATTSTTVSAQDSCYSGTGILTSNRTSLIKTDFGFEGQSLLVMVEDQEVSVYGLHRGTREPERGSREQKDGTKYYDYTAISRKNECLDFRGRLYEAVKKKYPNHRVQIQ